MKKIIALAIVIVAAFTATGQNNVGINTAIPNASAALDITATNKGLLIPRITTAARIGITAPAKGLMVYDSTVNNFYYYTGSAWKIMDTLPEKTGNTGKYLTTDGTNTSWAAATGSGGASLQLFAASTIAQTRQPYAYSRFTFNYDNKVSGNNQAAWTNNNTYTVPAGLGGLYNINLAIILSAYNGFTTYNVYPEIQLTRASVVSYYYGSSAPFSTSLSGNDTDVTVANAASVGQPPTSYSRGILNVTVPLQAGDIIKVFYRGSQNSTNATQTVSFSTDGSSYLSIVKLN